MFERNLRNTEAESPHAVAKALIQRAKDLAVDLNNSEATLAVPEGSGFRVYGQAWFRMVDLQTADTNTRRATVLIPLADAVNGRTKVTCLVPISRAAALELDCRAQLVINRGPLDEAGICTDTTLQAYRIAYDWSVYMNEGRQYAIDAQYSQILPEDELKPLCEALGAAYYLL